MVCASPQRRSNSKRSLSNAPLTHKLPCFRLRLFILKDLWWLTSLWPCQPSLPPLCGCMGTPGLGLLWLKVPWITFVHHMISRGRSSSRSNRGRVVWCPRLRSRGDWQRPPPRKMNSRCEHARRVFDRLVPWCLRSKGVEWSLILLDRKKSCHCACRRNANMRTADGRAKLADMCSAKCAMDTSIR